MQIEFSSLNKNILYVLYSKEIYIFDLVINQTVGYVQLERTSGLFVQMFLCSQRDIIYCLHDNGVLSARVRLKDKLGVNNYELNYETLTPHDFAYDTRTQSDPIRITKSLKVFSLCVSPVDEKTLILLLNDGRLLIYELNNQKEYLEQQKNNHKNYLRDLVDSTNEKDILKLNLKFYLNSMLFNLPQLPFVMKICPPMTRKNWSIYESLLAVGCVNGDLYVYQLESGNMWRKYSLHTNPIRGIEWLNLKGVLTWSNNGQMNLNSTQNNITQSGNNSSGSGTSNFVEGKQFVKNEILYTDLRTGNKKKKKTFFICSY